MLNWQRRRDHRIVADTMLAMVVDTAVMEEVCITLEQIEKGELQAVTVAAIACRAVVTAMVVVMAGNQRTTIGTISSSTATQRSNRMAVAILVAVSLRVFV